MYTVYTDGAYSSSNDSGGLSAIITHDGNIIKKITKGFKHTTNNRMEAMAVLETLKWFDSPETIEIYSDSQYVVNTIKQGWIFKWIEDQDLSKKNLDIWFEIADLLKYHNVIMHWIKGHNNDYYNSMCDMLAVHASHWLNLPIDQCKNLQLKNSATNDIQMSSTMT